MDPELRQSIIEELRKYLKREPTEKEIINAQTDSNIMGWVSEKRLRKVEKVKVL